MVQERTAELVARNRALEEESRQRDQATRALKAQASKLKRRTQGLEQANTALKVLLNQREKDKRELEEKVALNVDEVIMPFVRRVRQGRLAQDRAEALDALEAALKSIASPLVRHLSLTVARLTPAEVQVVELIRQGRSTKEMANLLDVAQSTIDYHRHRIRRKLGLGRQKINLRTFLQTLPPL